MYAVGETTQITGRICEKTLLDTHKSVAVSDKGSFTGATEVKRLSVRFNKRA
jgi:hypothetical protein